MPENSIADILAIAAHRDDVEQTCGGTLLKMKALRWRTAILDLTQGEAGTRGSAADRAAEAADAARILGVSWRQALDIPDGRVENTYENRVKIVRALREVRPRVVTRITTPRRRSATRRVSYPGWPSSIQGRRRTGRSKSCMRASIPMSGPASL